jgi:hypothetical protein
MLAAWRLGAELERPNEVLRHHGHHQSQTHKSPKVWTKRTTIGTT